MSRPSAPPGSDAPSPTKRSAMAASAPGWEPPLRVLIATYLAGAAVWASSLYGNLVAHLRFEDALIVLRYARNLARGEGFVFNPGEAVLGVTTPLHTLLSVLYVWLGGEQAPQVQNLAGCLALIAGGLVLLVLLYRTGFAWAGLFVAWLSLGNFHQNYLFFGMETHLFALLVMLVLALEFGALLPRSAQREDTAPAADRPPLPAATARREIVLGALLGIAFLVRYDAALLALLIGLRHWWIERRPPLRLTLTFFAVVTPWLLFALFTFGSILPNALLAKEGYFTASKHLAFAFEHYRITYQGLLEAFVPGPETGTELARRWSFWYPLPIALGVLSAGLQDRRFFLVAAYLALHLGVYAAIGSDPGFTWHYYLLTPFGYLFFALGFRAVLLGGRALLSSALPARLQRPVLSAVVALVLMALFAPLLQHLWQQANYRYQMDPHTTQLYDMSRWLREHYPPETSLLQPSIGVLGYETGFRIIDHAGLVTPGLYFYNDVECTPMPVVVERFAPDLILLSQWSVAEVEPLGYSLVHTFEAPFTYRVYARSGLAPPIPAATPEGTAEGTANRAPDPREEAVP